ncbi:hypothetical protein H4K35_03965 [Myroides sp. NP-2]|uniref:hypothetical protein n=1 Tax=Myroides sp. NP-2 TaxID=2759945 RepID=UPI0015F90F0E|nr:hypothetical protein [Myroides sp. NP-2]MBB1149296.1 hypothetical protein [Myroides sp. NP-2]
MFKTLLSFISLFCFLNCLSQQQISDAHQLVWVKGLSTGMSKAGFNYNTRIHFGGVFPILNKKLPTSQHTYVYYVVKSIKANEKLFSIYDDGALHTFYTDVIKSDLEVKVDLAYLAQGAIVNFNFVNANYRNKNGKRIFYLDNTYDKSNTALYEVLICNDCGNPITRNKIETYLALKYGITLADKTKYWSSNGVQLWDAKLNAAFNNHIIGLGKDRYFGLEQLATSSNEEPGVVLKKADNEEILANQSFVLIGDNAKEKAFDSQSNRFKRQWLVQNKGDHDLLVDFSLAVAPEKDMDYYLYTAAGGEIAQDKTDTLQLSFKNITVNTHSNTYWSIGRVQPFAIDIEQDTLGINHSYQLLTTGASEPPYAIQATDLNTHEAYFFVTEHTPFALSELPKSTYSFTVRDSHEQQATLDSIALDFDASNLIVMPSTWTLNGRDLLTIQPQLKKPNSSYRYRWYLGDRIISTAPVLRVNYPSDFSLEVTDLRGKHQRFDFSVNRKVKTSTSLDEQWLVSPNPVKAGEEFNVHYFFESPKRVDFYIYTVEGKFMQRQQLGLIEGGEYTYRLGGKTTYLLVSIINSKTSIQKLIVK